MRKRVRLNTPDPAIVAAGQAAAIGPKTIQEALTTFASTHSEPALRVAAKEYGVGMSLVGVAEIQTRRLDRITKTLEAVEQSLFTTARIKHMSPAQLLMFYKMASDAMRDAGKFLGDVSKVLDWDRLSEHATTLHLIEQELKTKQESGDLGDEQVTPELITKISSELLSQLSILQAVRDDSEPEALEDGAIDE